MEAGEHINLVLICGEAWIVHNVGGPHSKLFSVGGDVPVKVIVTLRKNETGEIVKFDDYVLWYGFADDCPSAFIWEDGNYSCDCNREAFFERELGRDFDDEALCCTDGRFSVSLANKMGGRVFYDEMGGSNG